MEYQDADKAGAGQPPPFLHLPSAHYHDRPAPENYNLHRALTSYNYYNYKTLQHNPFHFQTHYTKIERLCQLKTRLLAQEWGDSCG